MQRRTHHRPGEVSLYRPPGEGPDLFVVQGIQGLPSGFVAAPGDGYGSDLHALRFVKRESIRGGGHLVSTLDQSWISEQCPNPFELDLCELEREIAAVLHRSGLALPELVTASTDMDIEADRVGDLGIWIQWNRWIRQIEKFQAVCPRNVRSARCRASVKRPPGETYWDHDRIGSHALTVPARLLRFLKACKRPDPRANFTRKEGGRRLSPRYIHGRGLGRSFRPTPFRTWIAVPRQRPLCLFQRLGLVQGAQP